MGKKQNREQKKILVVDDNEGILEAFEVMLEDAGYEVDTSTDAEALLNLKSPALPDLILLDVLLSGADGRDMCKKMKLRGDLKHIPVIMISAHPGVGSTIKDAGATDFLRKPFEMDELLAMVQKYL